MAILPGAIPQRGRLGRPVLLEPGDNDDTYQMPEGRALPDPSGTLTVKDGPAETLEILETVWGRYWIVIIRDDGEPCAGSRTIPSHDLRLLALEEADTAGLRSILPIGPECQCKTCCWPAAMAALPGPSLARSRAVSAITVACPLPGPMATRLEWLAGTANYRKLSIPPVAGSGRRMAGFWMEYGSM